MSFQTIKFIVKGYMSMSQAFDSHILGIIEKI